MYRFCNTRIDVFSFMKKTKQINKLINEKLEEFWERVEEGDFDMTRWIWVTMAYIAEESVKIEKTNKDRKEYEDINACSGGINIPTSLTKENADLHELWKDKTETLLGEAVEKALSQQKKELLKIQFYYWTNQSRTYILLV